MKFLNFLFFLFFVQQSVAQQNHFIYIQTENKQPFYIKFADRVLSSSSSGYLVIPKLKDSSYEVNIGFPKNEWPLQKITVAVKNADAGYVLKNFGSKGWGLFNLQTLAVLMASGNAVNENASKDTSSDGFANTLADVVNTPSIKQKTAIPGTKDTSIVKVVAENKQPEIKQEPVAEVVKAPVRLSSVADAGGISVVYVDASGNEIDTVRIFIPSNSKSEIKNVEVDPVKTETVKKQEPAKDVKFINMEVSNPNSKDSVIKNVSTETKDKTEPKAETKNNAVIIYNSDCKLSASDDDFLKLRKKMAAGKTDDDMVAVAKKAFKSKCYSTEQVSNLAVLFLKDEGRYNFFDAAYPRVSDTQNFAGLVSKLSDEYYITRFKAMIRH